MCCECVLCCQAPLGERLDPSLSQESAKYRGMYQKLILEQLRLKKWDSVSSILDSMCNAQGMAPSLSFILTILDVRYYDGAGCLIVWLSG